MPTWSLEHVQPPWSKPHTVSLANHEVYDRAAANGGSNKIERHAPLSLASGHGRKAGTSGAFVEQDASSGVDVAVAANGHLDGYKSPEDWKQALEDRSHVINVRHVKHATLE